MPWLIFTVAAKDSSIRLTLLGSTGAGGFLRVHELSTRAPHAGTRPGAMGQSVSAIPSAAVGVAFALTEIMVRADWRRRGYARNLHDALLANRSEKRATLLVLPDNVPARTAYLSWGWYKLGDLQPFDDAPIYEAMVLDLK